jgi:hypothetical protein
MPKPLTKSPPTSSVATMLQMGVGAQVLTKPEAPAAPILPVPVHAAPVPPKANLDEMRPSGEIPDDPQAVHAHQKDRPHTQAAHFHLRRGNGD